MKDRRGINTPPILGLLMTVTKKSFIFALIIYAVPSIVLAVFFSFLLPDESPKLDMYAGFWGAVSALLIGGILIPFAETAILLWPTVIAYQILDGRIIHASFLGSIPLALLHLMHGWPKVIILIWSFCWSAYCFLSLFKQGERLRSRFIFVFGLHAITNSLLILTSLVVNRLF